VSRVVAAIDHSDMSEAVVIMARAVAHALAASVEVTHVREGDDEAPHPLNLAAGPPVRHLSGDPVELLPLLAAEDDVVAFVIGAGLHSHGHRRARQPGARPPEKLRTAVVAMEGTPGKARALQRSIEISSQAGLEIVVVHVHDEASVPSFSDQVQHESEAYAEEFFSRHLIGAPRMRLELRIGNSANEVLAAVESAHADLVAVGWPRSEDPRRGAVAKEILGRSPVAVLLVAMA
jgi:hypothetical protein